MAITHKTRNGLEITVTTTKTLVKDKHSWNKEKTTITHEKLGKHIVHRYIDGKTKTIDSVHANSKNALKRAKEIVMTARGNKVRAMSHKHHK